MKVARTPLVLTSEEFSLQQGVERSVGCHLMEVVEYVARVGGFVKRSDDMADRLDDYGTFGFLWERAIAREYAAVERERDQAFIEVPEIFWCRQCEKVFHGREASSAHIKESGHRGIFGTPDGFNTSLWCVEEFKVAWKSSRNAVGDGEEGTHLRVGLWKWPQQVMWYADKLGTRKARIRSLFVNGDYKPPAPEAWQYMLEFSEEELRNNHQMVVNNAVDLGWV